MISSIFLYCVVSDFCIFIESIFVICAIYVILPIISAIFQSILSNLQLISADKIIKKEYKDVNCSDNSN